MPAFLENWMGPCLRRDDLLKKQTLHQHIEKHYLFFQVCTRKGVGTPEDRRIT